jgi:hypothetical protein
MSSKDSFNYEAAFGSNPWLTPTQSISGLVSRMIGSMSSQQSQGGSSLNTAASVHDAEVGDYMDQVLGGQRNQLDEYVRRAAGAGIKRGGMNVVGGPALESSLHHQAMGTLAGGYADRLKDALSYDKNLKTALYNQYTNNIRDLENMLGIQQRYLSSQADWTDRLGNLRHGDWRDELDWRRDTPFRELKLENQRRQAQMEGFRNQWERQDRDSQQDQRRSLSRAYDAYVSRPSTYPYLPNLSPTDFAGVRAKVLGIQAPGAATQSRSRR